MDKNVCAQFYTVRDYTKTIEEFEKTCEKVLNAGYKTVQISGTPLEAEPMKKVLDKFGLKCVCTHRSFDDFEKNIEEIIDYNKMLGSDVCGVGMMPYGTLKDENSLFEFIEKVNKICARLKKENLYFGYHNHSLEFSKIGGKTVFDIMTENINADNFTFIFDVYWAQVGGVDPSTTLEKLSGKALCVHFKDYGINRDTFAVEMKEIGYGNLDWKKIIRACEKAGTKYAIVEQDENWTDNDPFKSLRMSCEFLKTKGFE